MKNYNNKTKYKIKNRIWTNKKVKNLNSNKLKRL